MFSETRDFNQNIGKWDVSSVTKMSAMFYKAGSFNQDIGNWNVSNVTLMPWMFMKAPDFNQDIGDWDVSNVTDFLRMFFQASSFDQDLGNWLFRYGTELIETLSFCGMSCKNYDNTILGWYSNDDMPRGILMIAHDMKYWMAKTAREVLVKYKNWYIYSDKYENCNYTTSTDDLLTTHQIELFPNPTAGIIMVNGLAGGEVEVIDLLGKVLKRTHIQHQLIDISDLNEGLYYLNIISEGTYFNAKVILSH